MFDDELDDDASSGEGPIHPDDRLWRHPSEIGSVVADLAARPPSAVGRIWTVAVLAGLTGAAVALTTLAITGSFSTRVIERGSAVTPVSDTSVSDRSIASAATTKPVASVLASSSSPKPKTVRRIVDETAAVMAHITVVASGSRRQGSGIVVRADGALLTSEALVRDADRVMVTLADGRVATGSVAGSDAATGLAVVRVPLAGLRVAVADRVAALPGDPAIIVTGAASPDDHPWVSAGVVSSTDQRMASGGHTLAGLIETDRPVPASADGSALVSADGNISGLCLTVGADQATLTSGYAVPMTVADGVARELLAYGRARKAWLGVEGEDLDGQAATELGVVGGAVLSSVATPSPAAGAGLKVGDVVIELAGRPVHSMGDLIAMLPLYRPDEQVAITLMRTGSRKTLTATLGERR